MVCGWRCDLTAVARQTPMRHLLQVLRHKRRLMLLDNGTANAARYWTPLRIADAVGCDDDCAEKRSFIEH